MTSQKWDPEKDPADRALARWAVWALAERLGVARAVSLITRHQVTDPRDIEPRLTFGEEFEQYLVRTISSETIANAVLTAGPGRPADLDLLSIEQWHRLIDDATGCHPPRDETHPDLRRHLYGGASDSTMMSMINAINGIRKRDDRCSGELSGPCGHPLRSAPLDIALDLADTLGLPPLAVFRDVDEPDEPWGMVSGAIDIEDANRKPPQLAALEEIYSRKRAIELPVS